MRKLVVLFNILCVAGFVNTAAWAKTLSEISDGATVAIKSLAWGKYLKVVTVSDTPPVRLQATGDDKCEEACQFQLVKNKDETVSFLRDRKYIKAYSGGVDVYAVCLEAKAELKSLEICWVVLSTGKSGANANIDGCWLINAQKIDWENVKNDTTFPFLCVHPATDEAEKKAGVNHKCDIVSGGSNRRCREFVWTASKVTTKQESRVPAQNLDWEKVAIEEVTPLDTLKYKVADLKKKVGALFHSLGEVKTKLDAVKTKLNGLKKPKS